MMFLFPMQFLYFNLFFFTLKLCRSLSISFVGKKVEAVEYSRQMAKAANRTSEVGPLMWAMVQKEPEKRYPHLFNPTVWHQLELRIARVLSRSDNYLHQM